MLILIAIATLFLFSSFRKPRSCQYLLREVEYGDTVNKLIIFPICGDSSLFIVRYMGTGSYWVERVYRNKQLHTVTRIDLVKPYALMKETGNTKYDVWETIYANDTVQIERTEALAKTVPIKVKRFWLRQFDDTIAFVITYYPNGLIQRYGLAKNGCEIYNGAEMDSLNSFLWTGEYSPNIVYDTVTKYEKHVGHYWVIKSHCHFKKGLWEKYNYDGKVIESKVY